jgi:hypothetical protein
VPRAWLHAGAVDGLTRASELEYEVVETVHGWAVSAGLPYYLHEGPTKGAAEAFIDRCRGAVADRRAAAVNTEVDYRWLQPGDLYACRADKPLQVVTRLQMLSSGAAMVWHETPDMAPGSTDRFTLQTPGFPAYGRHVMPLASLDERSTSNGEVVWRPTCWQHGRPWSIAWYRAAGQLRAWPNPGGRTQHIAAADGIEAARAEAIRIAGLIAAGKTA